MQSDMGSGMVLTKFSKGVIDVGNLKPFSNVCASEIGLGTGLK